MCGISLQDFYATHSRSPLHITMSTSGKERDITLCALCKRRMNDPRYLLCLHTFCKGCIKTNARTVLKGIEDNYPCPLCKRKTSIPGGKTGKWLEDLPVNDLVGSLVAAHAILKGNVACKPCSRKGKSTMSSEWCESCREAMCGECAEAHATLRGTMKHDIVQISDLRKRPLKHVVTAPSCTVHDGEKLCKYCHDHKKVICTTCTAEGHRTCKGVVNIGDFLKTKQKDISIVRGTFDKQTKNATIVKEDRKDALASFEKMNLNTRNKILSVRKRLDDILLKCEMKSINEVETVYARIRSESEWQIEEADHLQEESEHASALLNTATKAGSDVGILQWLPKFEEESGRIEHDISEMNGKVSRVSIDFKTNEKLNEIITSVNSLGDLILSSTQENEKSAKPSKTILRRSPKVPIPRYADHIFSARTPSDEEPCWITGIATLASLLVLTDRNNSKVKLYDVNFKFKSEYAMEEAPFDVTAINGSQVGVTIPSKCVIQIYDIKTGVEPVKTIPVNVHCFGVSFANDKFVVSCPVSVPATVRIITLDGQEVANISPNDNFIPLFLRPWYVRFDAGGTNFYASDANKNHVSCINRSVFRHFKYVNFNMTGPRGITVGENGELFVCGWGSDNVHKIDADGNFVEEFLNRHNGVISPQNICLSVDKRQLMITLDPTSCNSDNVQIFII